jgi:hypothetical protein
MILFNFLKTGNPVYDAIISTIAISLFGFVVNYVYDYGIQHVLNNFSFDDLTSWFFKKNMIIIEGRKSSITSNYSLTNSVTSIYSNRFKAIWDYIISNIDTNKTIYAIKESHTNFQSSEQIGDNKRKNLDIFMVHQRKYFKIDEDIFVKAVIEKEDDDDEKKKVKTKTDRITIYLYSYKYKVSYLKKYIDDITEKYLASIKDNRVNNKFIYFLDKVKPSDDESSITCWSEHIFDSARTFNNMFFDGKKELATIIWHLYMFQLWYKKWMA